MRQPNWARRASITASLAALLFSATLAQAQSVGIVADPIDLNGGTGYVTIFDPQTKAVLGSIDIPSTFGPWDCCISPDETLGFVPNLENEVYVIDLTQNPPVLASGTNPIPITSPGENCCITCDGRYLVVCANQAGPVSVIDVAARAEVDTLDLGAGCHEIICCDDGANLLAVGGGVIRRLIIDSAGQLTDTGESLDVGGFVINVCCAPGSHTAVAVDNDSDTITSFTIPGLAVADTATVSNGSCVGVSCVICCEGDRLYVRADDLTSGNVTCFPYDWLTGQIGPSLFEITGLEETAYFFGVNQLAVNQDCTELYISEIAPTSQLSVYDATDGSFISAITDANIVGPAGVCLTGWWPTGDYMVTDNSDGDVTIFNSQFMSRVATVTVPNGGLGLLDCCITPDGTTGFVVNFTDQVWVIDLTTSPPQLAAGTNPIQMTNQRGENCSVTCDGRYLLVCNGGLTEPVSVIDIGARTEASFFPLQAGVGCTEVECCDDNVSVLAVGSDDVVRRLTIDAAGNLTDTGESLPLGDSIINVCCASGSLSGVAVVEDGTITSFTIHGMAPVDTRTLTGDTGISCSICWDGSVVYVRSSDNGFTESFVDCFYFERYTGQLSTPIPLLAGLEESDTFFGVNQILVSRDCSRIYVPQNSLTSVTSVYDAATGNLITQIIDPFNEEPLSVCCPPCCNPWILYASDGSGGNPSDLLILDPDTGDVIRNVGPIGYAVTGLAVDPFDGTLYGSTARASGVRALLTINKSTGAGTVVGDFNLGGETCADLTFCPDGTLLGWVEPSVDSLAMINKATGQAQIIGDSGTNTDRAGLAVDRTGQAFFGGRESSLAPQVETLMTLDQYFGQPTEFIPYVPGGDDIGLGMSFGPGNVLYAIERAAFADRLLVTVNSSSGAVTTIGRTVDRLDALSWDCPLPTPPVFKKVLIDGPDRDNDFQIDPIIEAHSHSSSTYVFRIEVNQLNLPPMMVMDEIPAQWKLIECVPDNAGDIVQDFGGPRDPDVHDHRSRIIQWFPTGNVGGLTCTVRTRRHGKRHYEPHDCGRCFINLGAQAFDTGGGPLYDEHGLPLITNPICIGAVKDKDHDHFIDWSGQGDEDGDGLTDWFECCILGTDPCKRDTDRDKVPDNLDADPLDKNVQ